MKKLIFAILQRFLKKIKFNANLITTFKNLKNSIIPVEMKI